MAFKNFGTMTPHGAPILRHEIVTNSVTSTVLDSVKIASGFIALATAGDAVFGHVTENVTDKGMGMETTGAAGAATGSYVGTFAYASDNQTVAKFKAEVDVSQMTLYSAEMDATIGTTTGSNLAGYHLDLVDEDTLDESTAATTAAQYKNFIGVDPNNSARSVVNIFESQVFNTAA